MKLSRCKPLSAVIGLVMLLLLPAQASASVPYRGYTWNSLGEDVRSINGYMYADSIDGVYMPTGPFNAPEDIFIANDDTIYLVDTGNSRIIHMNADLRVLRIIGDAEGPGRLNEPKGVFVKTDGTVFAADTKNQRIAVFDRDGKFVKELKAPSSPLLGKDFAYSPSKLIVDKRDYLFVVSDGNTQGLMQIDQKGEFRGFFGANHIGFSLKRLLIRLVATKEQKEQISAEKPLSFSNVYQDRDGAVYTTTLGSDVNQIKRLSPVGVDTLNTSDKKYGDIIDLGPFDVPSFIDITVNHEGLMTALDLQTGKVFQYDKLGNLLFVFGGIGNQDGLFTTPSSVDQSSDGTVYVVDKGRNRIDRFRSTPFADLVHRASALYVNGRYAEAEALWKQVIHLNSNFDMAYRALGKALYRTERYKEAMEYFKLARSKTDYSAAFREYRKEFAREHFNVLFGGMLLLYAFYKWVVPRLRKRMKKKWDKPYAGNAAMAREGDAG